MDSSAISEIQQYLRTLSFNDPRLFPVVVDGIFSNQTANAVNAFQQTRGLPVTGTVDPQTWDVLYAEYLKERPRGTVPLLVFFDSAHRLSPDDENETVAILQLVLNSLSSVYDNIPVVSVTGRYDAATETAVRLFQELHGLTPSGIVNESTWNILATLFNDLRRFPRRSI